MSRTAILGLLAAGGIQAAVAADSSHAIHYKTVDAASAKTLASMKRRHPHHPLKKQADGEQADLVAVQGFWFSNFTVGNSDNVQLTIDTGSSDLIVSPGIYQPSDNGVDTGNQATFSYGTTNPDGSGEASAYAEEWTDTVAQHGTDYTLDNQYVGDIQSTTNNYTFPGQGVIGYAYQDASVINQPNFMLNLCNTSTISSCRFGLALNPDEKTGTLYYGSDGSDAYDGSLVTVPALGQYFWEILGDVTLNGKTFHANAGIITDSGTTVIFGPTAQVKDLFAKAGVQAVDDGKGNVKGYYRCDSPPTVGFAFPASKGSKKRVNFNVLPEALEQERNGNNCTISIHGGDISGDKTWLVGQKWFQGKYLDHNFADNTMGFANLKQSS